MPPKVDPKRRMNLKELMVQSKLERITRGGCNKINPDQQCKLWFWDIDQFCFQNQNQNQSFPID